MDAKTLILFNHKGGVCKTQTTYNIAWMLTEKGKRVLLVDCDPQCNLSALMLKDGFDKYYTSEVTKNMNIKDGLRVAFESRPMPIEAVNCYVCPHNDKLFLLPGHMDLSEYEVLLNLAMYNSSSLIPLQNLPGALYELTRLCAEKYAVDYVFFDVSSGLGAINQVAFLSSDAFIVPTNPDPFSLMALQTLSKVLPRWKNWADDARPYLSSASYPLPDADMKFLGVVCQGFNGRQRDPTAFCSNTISDIKAFVANDFAQALSRYDMVYQQADYHMADIPDFGAMLQAANTIGVPVFDLPDSEIPEGVPFESATAKREEIYDIFSHIADVIIENVK